QLPENIPTETPLHSSLKRPSQKILVAHDRRQLNSVMSDFVGIVRSTNHLELARERIQRSDKAVEEYYLATPATVGVVELRNMTTVAELIVRSALRRHESRGLHYIEDYLQMSAGTPHDTIIQGKPTDEQ
ncbi:MAG: L-aspartate oxidase, partial [candidate division Zixibacteria bacterium]|nr:L-aspartate oxidase [candidate division Zixibacteria bacterium]